MNILNRLRGVSKTLVLTVAGAALLLAAGCGGPERAPRQPITGVDRPPEQRPANPHDEPATPPESPRPTSMLRFDHQPECVPDESAT